MRNPRTLALLLVIAVAVGGCTLRDRRWGTCAVAGAVVGGTIGGITGGALANNADNDPADDERGAAIGGGIAGGAALGALIGHALCDPMKEAPPPPPPPPPAPPAAPKKIVELKGAHFDFDRADLKPEGKAHADIAVRAMKDDPGMRVSVEGHTDSVGTDAYNQGLSERRARTVRDYLVSQGIAAGRITVKGFGESKPVASNATDAGRAQNRRVEILAP